MTDICYELKIGNGKIYPFHVYDTRKSHGFIYSPIDNLYHLCDGYRVHDHIVKDNGLNIFTGNNMDELTDISLGTNIIIIKDLRPLMDISNNMLPISLNKIIIPSTKEYRDRVITDCFTYCLEPPSFNDKTDSHIAELIPNPRHRTLVRNFIKQALIQYTPNTCIILTGARSGCEALYSLLEKLNPCIKRCRKSLYCESEIKSKITLNEIYESRIVLCDIETRTLRIAKPNCSTNYTLQYHGIVFTDQTNSRSTIQISEAPSTTTELTPSDILGWIIQ